MFFSLTERLSQGRVAPNRDIISKKKRYQAWGMQSPESHGTGDCVR